ncbi:MAG: tetratricopeptide repeat protein [Thermoguttaceae bacterium]|jgi:tetratricopeptide (TPR) repeat protein
MTIYLPHRLFLCFTAALVVVFSGGVLSANEAEDAYQRGLAALGQGEFDQAVAAFSDAVKLKPDEAKFHGMRATAWLRKGDYGQGLADMKEAIRLNPNDLGEKYQPTSNKELSAEALTHGRKQVEKMLKDRPAMAQYGEEIEFMRSWAARKFAGEDLGSLIDWDSTPPVHSDAEHVAPEGKLHGAILIEPNYADGPKQGQGRSFEELWAGAVFELHNINNAKEFVRLRKEAEEGKVSKEDYVAGIVKYEMLAAQRTRAYYVQVFLPFAEKKKLPTEPGLWFTLWWVRPDEALKQFTDKTAYPWRPYARDHDWATVEGYWRRRQYEKAIELLNQMCAESEGMPDHAEVHLWLGRCRIQLGQYPEAVKELTSSIHLDPTDPVAFRNRAEAYRLMNQNERVELDLKRAEELEKKEDGKGAKSEKEQ